MSPSGTSQRDLMFPASLVLMTGAVAVGGYGVFDAHPVWFAAMAASWALGLGLAFGVRARRQRSLAVLADDFAAAFEALLHGQAWSQLSGGGDAAEFGGRCNTVLTELETTLAKVRGVTAQVRATSRHLAGTSNEASQAAMQVAQTVEQLARGAGEQTEGVTQAAGESETMARAAEDVSDNARATAEISAEASRAAQEGSGALQDVVTKMGNLRATVADSAGTVTRLGQLSQEIGQIVDLIRGLAGQTNLLALNAAIEAARAGDHGRGFAVVAEEVRKLAVESAGATERIQNMIEEIQIETLRAVKAMDRGTSEVEEGVRLIELAGSSFTGIVRSIEMTDRQVAQISRGAEALSTGILRLVEGMNGIAAVAEESAAGAEEVAASAQEQNSSMQDIMSAAQGLSEAAEQLIGVLDSSASAGPSQATSRSLAHVGG